MFACDGASRASKPPTNNQGTTSTLYSLPCTVARPLYEVSDPTAEVVGCGGTRCSTSELDISIPELSWTLPPQLPARRPRGPILPIPLFLCNAAYIAFKIPLNPSSFYLSLEDGKRGPSTDPREALTRSLSSPRHLFTSSRHSQCSTKVAYRAASALRFRKRSWSRVS
jgi:hypothetical protein